MNAMVISCITPPNAPVVQQADASDPRTWSAGEWLEIGGLISAAIAWIWRHTLRQWMMWIFDWFRMPSRIRDIEAQVALSRDGTTMAIAMARATWDTLTEIPVWQSDALGLCVHASKTMLRVLGRQASEILGDNWRQIIHQPDRPLVYAEWDACIHERRDLDLTYHWVHSDGSLIKIHVNANRILGATGEIIGWVSFVRILS